MSFSRRSAAGLLAGVLLLTTACSAIEDEKSDPVGDLTTEFVDALGNLDLTGIPLTEPGAAAAFGEQIEPIAGYFVAVSAGEVTSTELTGTVPLHWEWDFDGATWSYDTSAVLSKTVGSDANGAGTDGTSTHEGWAVEFRPSVVVPDMRTGQVLHVERSTAPRADILGAGAKLIVTERDVQRYGLDKTKIKPGQVRASARRIAEAVGIDPGAYANRAASMGPRAFVEAIVVRAEDTRDVSAAFAEVPGAFIVHDALLLAPTPTFAYEVLGTAGPATAEIIEKSEGRITEGQTVGRSRLQLQYDDVLRGSPTYEIFASSPENCPEESGDGDARGEEESAQDTETTADCEPVSLAVIEGRAPQDLQLSLDVDLQIAAEKILTAATGAGAGTSTDGPASALVALRPSTGEVLVAANGPGNKDLNIAAEGQYPPGSTFKVITALALLRSGLDPADPLPCPNTINVDGRSFKNFDGYPASAVGDVNFKVAFANSCNTALIGARDRFEPADLAGAAAALGIGQARDVGFPAYFGQVPEPASETEWAADLIGQGTILASPLAMATVAASVQAGHAVTPILVTSPAAGGAEAGDAAAGGAGEPDATPATPLTEGEVTQLRELMRGVVTGGTAPFLASLPGEPVIAKTGTAEHGGADKPHVWMIAAQGDLAVAVFVAAGVGGADTAGPLIKSFLDAAN